MAVQPGPRRDLAAAQHDRGLAGGEPVPGDQPQDLLVALAQRCQRGPQGAWFQGGRGGTGRRERTEPRQQIVPPPLLAAVVAPQVTGHGVQPRHRVIGGHVADAPPGDLQGMRDQVLRVRPGQSPVPGITAQRRVRQLEQCTETSFGVHTGYLSQES